MKPLFTSCDLPTSSDSNPSATTVSVALGSSEMTRKGG